MAGALRLTVVTPQLAMVDEAVDAVQLPGRDGYLGVLPGHAPLFSELQTGILSYSQGGRTTTLAISRGFVEVLEDAVRVLADVAESADTIDIHRAAEARERAERLMHAGGSDTDYRRAQAAYERASIRLKVAGEKTD